VVYFERWNWDAGTDPAWGQQTATQGEFMHTGRDVFDNIDAARIEPVAETVTALAAMLATGAAGPPG
jgi:hypothetical protein